MIVIVCLDDRAGQLFHGRRQSQDRAVRKNILYETQGAALWIDAYSAGQFDRETARNLHVDENFLDKASAGAYCFVEGRALTPYTGQIEQLIAYRWNRVYPADVRLDLDLTAWHLVRTEDFTGHSHEKITKEIYIP